jgi:phage-related minor tail protein
VAKLKELNPNANPGSDGKFDAGTVLVLPKGKGDHVAAAQTRLDKARDGVNKAEKAVTDAVTALETARKALEAAEAAAKEAKTAATEAQKAADAAQKAYDDAVAAAKKTDDTTTDGGGDKSTPVQKMKDELTAAKDKSFDDRNAIFHSYFDKETDTAKKQELFVTFMETCSTEERDRVMKFLESQSGSQTS